MLEEESERELEINTTTEQVENEKKQLDNLPRFEDISKSETITQTNIDIPNTTETKTIVQDKFFTKKEDEKKVYLRKRVKLVMFLYLIIVIALMTLVGVNIATLVNQGNTIKNNEKTINDQIEQITLLEE